MSHVTLGKQKKGQICGVLSIGGSILTAARAVGCHPSTIYNTAKRDPEFAEHMAEARGGHEVTLLSRIDAASQDIKYWRAAAWALERMYPERYRTRSGSAMPRAEMRQFVEQVLALVSDEIGSTVLYDRILKRANQQIRLLEDSVDSTVDSPTDDDDDHDNTRYKHNGHA